MTKRDFIIYINQVKNAYDFDTEVSDLTRKYHMDFSESNTSNLGESVTELLSEILKDEDGVIDYWCWEKNFGRSFEVGNIVEADGSKPDLKDAGALWDYLKNRKSKPEWVEDLLE